MYQKQILLQVSMALISICVMNGIKGGGGGGAAEALFTIPIPSD